jgi:hypothetical protein
MLVSVLGFGSVWRHRVSNDSRDAMRFARAAYYNTTGVMVNGRLRTRPRILGHVRFNGMGGFDPNCPTRMVCRVFECEEPCVLPPEQNPDRYLVVVRVSEVGRLLVGETGWSSDDIWLVALSEWREEQEAMLLMAIRGRLRTSVGTYTLAPVAAKSSRARLELRVREEA